MDKRMLKCRKIVQLANSLATELKDESCKELIDLLKTIENKYKEEYDHFKQIEKTPTIVFQMFGKPVHQLSESEFREYKAFLKRMRTQKKVQEKIEQIQNS